MVFTAAPSKARTLRVLLLGGSAEASALARMLAPDKRFEATLSLAGRTAAPQAQPIPVRSGGFGGAQGLARYLKDERMDVLVDATHPFAAQISRNAIEAASTAGIPLLAVERPAWERQPSDDWTHVSNMAAAVAALGSQPRVVFSAGSLVLSELAAAPQHTYIVRLIDKPAVLEGPANIVLISARGPFTAEEDIRLFERHRVDVVLAKNSGGHATASKIQAARALRLPVIMVQRPYIPRRPAVPAAEYAMIWLARHYNESMLRGV
jgi:precorrin-6A/cobalt-precorrin-6A reductase